jgi:hypothetical protein
VPYSDTITALDLGNGVGDVRVTAGYHWHVTGVGEQTSDEVTLDVAANTFLSSNGATFSYGGNLAPQPKADWYIGLWIQEIPRIASGTGWLFRSGQYTTEPPTDPIEVILAPEQFIGAVELSGAVGPLPMTSGSTTITALMLTVHGKDVDVVATGTDTGLPPGDTFTYTATLVLIPNGSKVALDTPFEIRLDNQSIGFSAGVGTGFSTALLNLISGIILSEVSPKVKSTVRGTLNAGVLSSVATRLNRGVPTSMPPGVVLSIRNVRATTRPTPGGGTESVIGVLAALGAYGGVLNKFPALTPGGGGCFVATAAVGPAAPEVLVLREWRDAWLRRRRGGTTLIRAYERLSPPLARFIAQSDRRRALTRQLVVAPAVRLARRLLG